MVAKLLRFHGDAREKICAGLNMLANAVKTTLGPKGRLVMLERSYGPPLLINSGVIVAKEIELEDHLENLGHSWREKSRRRRRSPPATARRRRRSSRRRS